MKKVYLLLLISTFPLTLFSQVHWTKHPDNPIMIPGSSGEWDSNNIYPGSVIYYDSTYHMWYVGNNLIGHATSPDGINWTKDIYNPVLEVGPGGAWDDGSLLGCRVLIIDSIFHMFYTGHTGFVGNTNYGIGHATSPDGVSWAKDTNNPVMDKGLEGEWDELWVFAGSIIHDGNSFHLWYTSGNSHAIQQIGHATSPDGINWIRDPQNPVLSPLTSSWELNLIGCFEVIFDGLTYHLWYHAGGSWPGNYYSYRFGYATSENGSSWSKHADNPVMREGSEESWDAKSFGGFTVMDSAGIKYKMWYNGSKKTNTTSIGYADSDKRVPYLTVNVCKTAFDSTDTIVSKIATDGIIYIVPEGTSLVVDSIIKNMIVSIDVLANIEAQIPLKDLSIGQYTVIAVSNVGFASIKPFLLRIVDDATPPELTLAENTVNLEDAIVATSTKDGMLYLVNIGPQYPDKSTIEEYCMDTLHADANVPVEFSTSALRRYRSYLIYAADIYGIISQPDTITVLPYGTGVKANIRSVRCIYPNPVNDILTIETGITKQQTIEITSLNGQLFYRDKIEGSTHQIDLSTFQKGVYIIIIRSKDLVTTEKIIKL